MTLELTEGLVVAHRYRLVRLLGEGGMGAVWAATHIVTRKAVALKFLKAAGAAHAEVTRRFLREARAASAVRHPNVVQIHDVIQDEEGLPIMVMDLLEGESLGDRIARDVRIDLPEFARLILPAISAIGTAHSLGIVHRDLKPDNIFLVRLPDGRLEPRVLDFGIAKLSASEGDAAQTGALTRTGSMLGTPYYMSPEQAFGEKDVDTRADVWSMGIILYECLSGKRPVDGDNFGQLLKVITMGGILPLKSVAPSLPDDVTALVDQMLTVDRKLRPQSLHAAADVLKRYCDAEVPTFAPVKQEALATSSIENHARTSADAFARTTLATKGSRRSLFVALPIAAVLVGGAAVFFAKSGSKPANVPSVPSSITAEAAVNPPPRASDGPTVAPVDSAAFVAPPAASSSAPLALKATVGPTKPNLPGKPPGGDAKPDPPPAKAIIPGNMPTAAPF